MRLEANSAKVGDFRCGALGESFLITNDAGWYAILKKKEFAEFLKGSFGKRNEELARKGFVRDAMDMNAMSEKYALRTRFLCQGPSLHIVVVTLRCDHHCRYCQANAQPAQAKGWDMEPETATKVVDTIFETPSSHITIEFQGGEPLLNFPVIRHIVSYAQKKNRSARKHLAFSLVTNLTYMSEEIARFCAAQGVSVCTSLDGPKALHNKNRVSLLKGSDPQGNAAQWIRYFQEKIRLKEYQFKVNALATVTKPSLRYGKEIVDEYISLGLDSVFLRPVNPFTIGTQSSWKSLGVTSEEFLEFYKKALAYILERNKKGVKLVERNAWIFLKKILTDSDPNYLDVRSPCGAAIGQLAYNFNGDVYTCDEGRMISAGAQDEMFRLGNVMRNSYAKLLASDVVRTMCIASCTDNLPRCSACVFKPFCGVCPAYHYVLHKDLFPGQEQDFRCKVQYGIQEHLFVLLQNRSSADILQRWAGVEQRREVCVG